MSPLVRAEVCEDVGFVFEVDGHEFVDEAFSSPRERDDTATAVERRCSSGAQSLCFEAVDSFGRCSGGDQHVCCEFAGGRLVWWGLAAKRSE